MEELGLRGLRVAAQAPLPVVYKGKHVGTYSADLVVEVRLRVEVKCVEQFSNENLAQCINYLKASELHLATLTDFRRSRGDWKRRASQTRIWRLLCSCLRYDSGSAKRQRDIAWHGSVYGLYRFLEIVVHY